MPPRILPPGALLFLAILSTAGCGAVARAGGAAADTVFIGVAASATSGSNRAYFQGVRLAVEQLNRSAPPGARPFAVRLPAQGAGTQVAIAAAFRDDPAVIGVVGHTGSAQTLEAAPIYGDVAGGGRHAVLAISPGATSPSLAGVSPWVFRDCPTDNNMAAALAAFTVDSLKRRRVGLIYRNDLFGRGFARVFARELGQRGGSVMERDPYVAGITSYDAYALRMRLRGVEAVIVAGGAAEAGPMLRSLRAALGGVPVLGTDDMAALQGDTALGSEFRGLHYAAFYLPGGAADSAGGFESRYRARFGAAPDTRAALAYDAALLFGAAVREVGPDRRKVRDYVASVGNARPAFRGITGDIRFDARGDAVGKPVFITEVGR